MERRWGWMLVAGAVLLVVATACTQSPGVPKRSPDVAPSSGPAPASPSGPAPSTVPGPGPAWDSVFKGIRPDGSVDTPTALQAFSLAFGPLPGVALPTGSAGCIPDATGPLQLLVGHWADITPGQRAAAIRLRPELASLDSGSASSAAATADRVAAGST